MRLHFALAIAFGLSCPDALAGRTTRCATADEFRRAVAASLPGDTVILRDGVHDLGGPIAVTLTGSPRSPVVIRAENRGRAELTGDSRFLLRRSSHVVLEGFQFSCTGGPAVRLEGCRHVRVTRNVFHLVERQQSTWLLITGVKGDTAALSGFNRVDHNLFENKRALGNFLTIEGTPGPRYQVSEYDTIDHNHFRDIGPRVENVLEAIRVGSSDYSLSSGFTILEHNLFERCDGDPEVLSIKSSDNEICYNTFRECLGVLSLRHGNRNTVRGNFLLGNGRTGSFRDSTGKVWKLGTGGIRFYGDGMKILNNYLAGLTGTRWDATLAVTSGNADYGEGLSLTKHYRIRNAIIAFNTFVNNAGGIEIGYDGEGFQGNWWHKPPQNILFANNLIVGSSDTLIKIFQQPLAASWVGNIAWATQRAVVSRSPVAGVRVADPQLVTQGELQRPQRRSPVVGAAAGSFSWVADDLDGQARGPRYDVGADQLSDGPILRRPLGAKDVGPDADAPPAPLGLLDIRSEERERVLTAADRFLNEDPITITAYPCRQSAGGLHDYYSEGDYWWPDPAHPGGPYIQRDGMTNPDNFIAHRRALMAFSVREATLVAAFALTGDRRYAAHALAHLRAWFTESKTKMNPHLLYGQAIRNKVTGRGVGIIDTIHLVEVARGLRFLEEAGVLEGEELRAVQAWFRQYLNWMMTHQYGRDERDAKNNHATCWVLQVAAFADMLGDEQALEFCRERFMTVLLPDQMAADGSFPFELKRTKPYGYSLFNLDAMAGICQIASNAEENLWTYELADGRSMRKGMDFLAPFIGDKSRWVHPKDVMYFDEWPVRQASLLFCGLAYGDQHFIDLWKGLDPDPTTEEILRNLPIRQPLLWALDPATVRAAPPAIYLMDTLSLMSQRESYRREGPGANPAIRALFRDAEKALALEPLSVTMKKEVPPSGDRHDFMSLAPYWWPDSESGTGLPYVRRDGETNPERDSIPDKRNWNSVSEGIETLSLAFFLSGERRYAAHSARLLRTWFLDPATRMNPNMEFSQAIKGANAGRGAGIIDLRAITNVVDALALLDGSRDWGEAERLGMRSWLGQYLEWLRRSPIGRKESEAKNNHGTWYDLQAVMVAIGSGSTETAREVLREVAEKRIAQQIEPDGSQRLELERTKSWGYSLLNLEGLTALARAGEKSGIDLWHFSTADGRSVQRAIDWLLPFALGMKQWSYTQIVPMELDRICPVLTVASAKLTVPHYAEALRHLCGESANGARWRITGR